MTAWTLPDQISDLLPPEAAVFERLRRRLIDLYGGYGKALTEQTWYSDMFRIELRRSF